MTDRTDLPEIGPLPNGPDGATVLATHCLEEAVKRLHTEHGMPWPIVHGALLAAYVKLGIHAGGPLATRDALRDASDLLDPEELRKTRIESSADQVKALAWDRGLVAEEVFNRDDRWQFTGFKGEQRGKVYHEKFGLGAAQAVDFLMTLPRLDTKGRIITDQWTDD